MNLEARIGEKTYKMKVEKNGEDYHIFLDGQEYSIQVRKVEGSFYSLLINNRAYELSVANEGERIVVEVGGEIFPIEIFDALYSRERKTRSEPAGKQIIRSIMPGKVIKLLVHVGDEVQVDQGIIIMEAMKMENEITAPKAGRVVDIKVQEGKIVESDTELITIE